MIINLYKKILYKFFLISLFVGIAFSFQTAKASTTLMFATSSTNIYKGQTFNVDLNITSTNKSINSVDGIIVYDKEKLEVKSVNTDSSLFTLWPKSPDFISKNGLISLVGGVPGGFIGGNKKIISIIFLAKQSGIAKIDFQDIFSVYLNDGLGTVIAPYLKPISISIINKPIGVILHDFWYNLGIVVTQYNCKIIFLIIFIIVCLAVYKRRFIRRSHS